MTELLLVAKAPVPGLAKTRLGAVVGMDAAAELAAASLLDSIAVCADAFPGRCHLALAGSLDDACQGDEIGAALDDWRVFEQEGDGLGERLANAHAAVGPGPVVQIGMDTPQVDRAALRQAATTVEHTSRAALGPALDGGWWLLALADPSAARVLERVPMSQPSTGHLTEAALRASVGAPTMLATLRDVDTVEDAAAVARLVPHRRFGATWSRVAGAAR